MGAPGVSAPTPGRASKTGPARGQASEGQRGSAYHLMTMRGTESHREPARAGWQPVLVTRPNEGQREPARASEGQRAIAGMPSSGGASRGRSIALRLHAGAPSSGKHTHRCVCETARARGSTRVGQHVCERSRVRDSTCTRHHVCETACVRDSPCTRQHVWNTRGRDSTCVRPHAHETACARDIACARQHVYETARVEQHVCETTRVRGTGVCARHHRNMWVGQHGCRTACVQDSMCARQHAREAVWRSPHGGTRLCHRGDTPGRCHHYRLRDSTCVRQYVQDSTRTCARHHVCETTRVRDTTCAGQCVCETARVRDSTCEIARAHAGQHG